MNERKDNSRSASNIQTLGVNENGHLVGWPFKNIIKWFISM